jgi:hypothetical protein
VKPFAENKARLNSARMPPSEICGGKGDEALLKTVFVLLSQGAAVFPDAKDVPLVVHADHQNPAPMVHQPA